MKTLTWLPVIGVALVVSGELLRKSAMFTASSNFDHYVQSEKKPNHQLVTSGVYSWVRHPSYVGWFYWSIGTQVQIILHCFGVCVRSFFIRIAVGSTTGIHSVPRIMCWLSFHTKNSFFKTGLK